jgi:hypothetical protein
MGQVAGVGVVLAAVLLVGLIVFGLRRTSRQGLRAAPAPLALLIGSVIFLMITGVSRVGSFGPQVARGSRYLHVVVALALPAVALGATALARRVRYTAPLFAVLFLVGVPGNVRTASDFERDHRAPLRAYKQMILGIPSLPVARNTPGEVEPDPLLSQYLTVGWLLAAERSGRLPALHASTREQRASNEFRLSLFQSRRPSPSPDCRALNGPRRIELRRGQSIGISGSHIGVAPVDTPLLPADVPLSYRPRYGPSLIAVVDHLTLQVRPPPFVPTTVCLPTNPTPSSP